jgi:hypothetical protein
MSVPCCADAPVRWSPAATRCHPQCTSPCFLNVTSLEMMEDAEITCLLEEDDVCELEVVATSIVMRERSRLRVSTSVPLLG